MGSDGRQAFVTHYVVLGKGEKDGQKTSARKTADGGKVSKKGGELWGGRRDDH